MTILHENVTLYEILDILPNASPQDVREAYVKTKATFNRDSVALYTIISTEEREDALKKIEEAYQVLSNPEKRRQYDNSFGDFNPEENPFESYHARNGDPPEPPKAQVISIDRVPPMENIHNSEQILIPPMTDFSYGRQQPNIVPPPPPQNTPVQSSTKNTGLNDYPLKAFPGFRETRSPIPTIDPDLHQAIQMETEWRGSFLKKVRELYRISLEEMAGITKVTKTYLVAIEDENYTKLPAPVYIRGFVLQMAKILKLPHEKVANAYLTRYHRTHKS